MGWSLLIKAGPALGGISALLLAACGGGQAATPALSPTRIAPTPTAPVPLATATPPTPTASPTPAPGPTPTGVSPTKESPRYGGTLRWAQVQDITHLDLYRERHPQAAVLIPVMSWLVVLKADEGLKPDLAERWEAAEGGKVVTFHLVKNARWHDDRPVTADDVVYSLDRVAFAKETESGPYRGFFSPLHRIEKVDDDTIRLVLGRPSASFLSALGINQIVIYPKHVPIAGYAKRSADAVIGSGPFKFRDYRAGVSISLARNPNYFKYDSGNQLPYLDGVEFPLIADPAAHYAAFRVGQVDITDPSYAQALAGKEKRVTQDVPGANVQIQNQLFTFFLFNVTRKPWDDARVRKAISLALDRQAFNDVYTQGLGTPYRAFSTPGTAFAIPEEEIRGWPGYSPATKRQDIDQAKRLLLDAGLNPADIKSRINLLQNVQQIGEVISRLIKDALGVDLALDVQERNVAVKARLEGTFDLVAGFNAGAFPDPQGELAPFITCGSALNYGRFCDPALDARLAELDTVLDQAKRIQLSRTLEKGVLLERVHWVIPSSSPAAFAWQKRVKGFEGFAHGSEGLPRKLERVWLAAQ